MGCRASGGLAGAIRLESQRRCWHLLDADFTDGLLLWVFGGVFFFRCREKKCGKNRIGLVMRELSRWRGHALMTLRTGWWRKTVVEIKK